MPSPRQVIHHHFGGGWATDFGPSVPKLAPDAAGNVILPFLVDAEDVQYKLDGAPAKAPGASKINASVLESGAAIRGIYDYWRQGTGGSATQKRVIHINDHIYADDADGSFTSLASGLETDAIPNYSTFDDLLIIASSSSTDVPKSWDQTTFQNLAGSPPNFSFSVKHQNFHWAAGVAANPSKLYYSNLLDPEDWAGGGSIDIDPNDGDHITGIISHKNELWVFKGPYKGSIHRITGAAVSDFARTTFIEGVGAVWQNSIFRVGDDVAFLWSDGSIRLLSATAAFGDFREASLTQPIQSWIDNKLNFAQLRKIWTVMADSGRKLLVALPINGNATNNIVLSLDFRFNPPRWSQWSSYEAQCLALVHAADDNSREKVWYGGTDGFVREFNDAEKSIDGTTGLEYKVTTPYIDYGIPQQFKTLEAGYLSIQPFSAGDITWGWQRGQNTQQTVDISQGGSDVLGDDDAVDETGEFVLGLSTLGGAKFENRFTTFDEQGGEFREIQYQFTNNDNAQNVEIHGFGTTLTVGAESLENN